MQSSRKPERGKIMTAEFPEAQRKPEDSGMISSRYSEKSNYKPRNGHPTKLPFRNNNKIKTERHTYVHTYVHKMSLPHSASSLLPTHEQT